MSVDDIAAALDKLTDSEFVIIEGYEDETDQGSYGVSFYRKRDCISIYEEDYGSYLGSKVRDVVSELYDDGFTEVSYEELQNR